MQVSIEMMIAAVNQPRDEVSATARRRVSSPRKPLRSLPSLHNAGAIRAAGKRQERPAHEPPKSEDGRNQFHGSSLIRARDWIVDYMRDQ
jgi:hypothetical protein